MDNVLIINMDWESFRVSLIKKDFYIIEEGSIGELLKTGYVRNVCKNIPKFWKCTCKNIESMYVKGIDKRFNVEIVFEEISDLLLFKLKYSV
jgi:hypothetical protein